MKVLGFTSIRSDYDLLSPLYRLLHEDQEIDFKLIVSGAHLSHQYGYSFKQIENDGFDVLLRIETLLNSDTAVARAKSAGLLLISCLEVIEDFDPDLLIYAGDREDVLIYSMIGGYLNIPTIHFSAGDHATDGYIDNSIRHATSKLSTVHFVDREEHKRRLISIGENEKRIFVIGAISLDNFTQFKPLPKKQLFCHFNIAPPKKKIALVIFHVITQEKDYADSIYINILENLREKNIFAFVSYPNIDPGNHKLLKIIKKYEGSQDIIFYKNLNRDIFLSLYHYADFIIGNSSSGICEAASLRKPAINVGLRQRGRFADDNVIFCDSTYESIRDAITKVFTDEFQQKLKSITNSYGDGQSALRAYKIIKETDFKKFLPKIEDPLYI